MTVDHTAADTADLEAYIASQLRGWDGPDRADLEGYLRAHPGTSVRDWKGKGEAAPADAQADEAPWFDLTERSVRTLAIATAARHLPRNVRQAAGRDPTLIWNPVARKYRARLEGEEDRPATPQSYDTGGFASGPPGLFPGRETGAPPLPGA